MSNKISVQEYENMGKINTKKALEELQKTLVERANTEQSGSDSESDYDFENTIDKKVSKTTHKFQTSSSSDDRAMCMFNNLIDRNQMLQDKLSKSENNYENLKRKMRDLERKEYTQMVQYTSLESKNQDLTDELKKKTEIIVVKNRLITSNARMGYINRFIIIGQLLIMTYIYLANNLDKMDNIFKIIS
jgi:hypothetical protein